jgi:hypothetical protein
MFEPPGRFSDIRKNSEIGSNPESQNENACKEHGRAYLYSGLMKKHRYTVRTKRREVNLLILYHAPELQGFRGCPCINRQLKQLFNLLLPGLKPIAAHSPHAEGTKKGGDQRELLYDKKGLLINILLGRVALM